ncbi:acyl carrier protein [Chrysiogenes arsenatis]|uniref:acyl carrier protein n=1 Tax=Chrysiogenes arsenatis TaxID=309797 RepID=UPI00040D9541|nr:phosphopantetheine-binding protein [Chrysiogenes arsenatis]
MTEIEIIEIVNAALAKEFELDMAQMTPEQSIFDDLGLDSLDMVDMVIVLEQAFSFKIRDEEEVRQIRTLGDIHRFIIQKKSSLS